MTVTSGTAEAMADDFVRQNGGNAHRDKCQVSNGNFTVFSWFADSKVVDENEKPNRWRFSILIHHL